MPSGSDGVDLNGGCSNVNYSDRIAGREKTKTIHLDCQGSWSQKSKLLCSFSLETDTGSLARNASSRAGGISLQLPRLLSTQPPRQTTTVSPHTPFEGTQRLGLSQSKAPSATPKTYSSSGNSGN